MTDPQNLRTRQPPTDPQFSIILKVAKNRPKSAKIPMFVTFLLFLAYFWVCSVFLSCRGSRCSQPKIRTESPREAPESGLAASTGNFPFHLNFRSGRTLTGKSTLWTNAGQDRDFQRTLRAIGPYLFLGKFIWTNGPESSSKVPPYTPTLVLVHGWLFPVLTAQKRRKN